MVMRRYLLDHLLVEQAKTLPNVTVREGFRVVKALQGSRAIQGVIGHPANQCEQREVFRAPLTIAADGMRSLFHNRYGIKRSFLDRQRFGVTGHLKGVEGMGSTIEVILQEGSEIYVAPCEDGLTLVAILFDKQAMRSVRGNLVQGYLDFLRSSEGFGERVRDSELVPPVMARGPFAFEVEPIYLAGLLLIGDSAGFLDPITGEGMTLALKCVQAAVPVIKEAFGKGDFGESVLARYAEERFRIIEDVFRLTQLMLDLSRFTRLSNRAMRRLSRDGPLFQKLLGIVTGTHRYRDLTPRDRLALAGG